MHRVYVIGETMVALGIPTARRFAVVTTGGPVNCQGPWYLAGGSQLDR
jgi:hypothetical protein